MGRKIEVFKGEMPKPDASQRRRMKSAHRRQFEIALDLYDFAEMTGYLPEVTTEALIRLHRERKPDYSNPANMRRFRELLDAITHERKGSESNIKGAELRAQFGHKAIIQA